jgi:hypothetical protein
MLGQVLNKKAEEPTSTETAADKSGDAASQALIVEKTGLLNQFASLIPDTHRTSQDSQ